MALYNVLMHMCLCVCIICSRSGVYVSLLMYVCMTNMHSPFNLVSVSINHVSNLDAGVKFNEIQFKLTQFGFFSIGIIIPSILVALLQASILRL